MDGVTIQPGDTVYIDSNIVIYAIEKIEPYSSKLVLLWDLVALGRVRIITSELTWMETLAKPIRDGNEQLSSLFRRFLTADDISMIPVNLEIWNKAAELRGLGFKTPDAIHAATALSASCNIFLTNDSQFLRVPKLSVLIADRI